MNQFYNNVNLRHSGPDPESLRGSIVILKAKGILNQVQDDVRSQIQNDVKKQVQDEVYTF